MRIQPHHIFSSSILSSALQKHLLHSRCRDGNALYILLYYLWFIHHHLAKFYGTLTPQILMGFLIPYNTVKGCCIRNIPEHSVLSYSLWTGLHRYEIPLSNNWWLGFHPKNQIRCLRTSIYSFFHLLQSTSIFHLLQSTQTSLYRTLLFSSQAERAVYLCKVFNFCCIFRHVWTCLPNLFAQYFFFYKILPILHCKLISKLVVLGKTSCYSKCWTSGFFLRQRKCSESPMGLSISLYGVSPAELSLLNYCNAVQNKWIHVVNNNVFCNLYIRNQHHHKSEIFWTDIAVHCYTWQDGLRLEMKRTADSWTSRRKSWRQ